MAVVLLLSFPLKNSAMNIEPQPGAKEKEFEWQAN
jgi:hypothetical protein